MLHRVHVLLRTIGLAVIVLLIVAVFFFYFSDEYDLTCDARKSLERGRAREPYHCFG